VTGQGQAQVAKADQVHVHGGLPVVGGVGQIPWGPS